ncbi:MAG: hypothetical protein WDW38_008857 [Sanguina aurantia]
MSEALSLLGAGVIMGAGLTVVLPEGFVTFLEAAQDNASPTFPEWSMGLALLSGFLAMLLLQHCHSHSHAEQHPRQMPPPDLAHAAASGRPTSGHSAELGNGGRVPARQVQHPDGFESTRLLSSDSHSDDSSASGTATTQAGSSAAALLSRPAWRWGTLSGSGGGGGSGHARWAFQGAPSGRSCAAGTDPDAGRGEAQGLVARIWSNDPGVQSLTALLVHSAADGIAVGARFCFLQIMRCLLLFSCSAPACALLSYYVLTLVPGMAHPQSIALAVLFSGGTFLFAATQHILPAALTPSSSAAMPDSTARGEDGEGACTGSTWKAGTTPALAPSLAGWRSFVFVASAFVPLVISALLPE